MNATLSPRSALLVGILLLLAAGLIGWGVEAGRTVCFDEAGLRAMAGGPADPWRLVSDAGSSIARSIIALVIATLLAFRRRLAPALFLAIASFAAMGLNSLAKTIVTRPRPGLLPHLEKVDTYSFPSGHSAGSAALGLALVLIAPPRWRTPVAIAAAIYALAVGFSRMALAVHWPSDVLAGWLSGAGWVLILYAVWRARSI